MKPQFAVGTNRNLPPFSRELNILRLRHASVAQLNAALLQHLRSGMCLFEFSPRTMNMHGIATFAFTRAWNVSM
jgi:hypothetical protein